MVQELILIFPNSKEAMSHRVPLKQSKVIHKKKSHIWTKLEWLYLVNQTIVNYGAAQLLEQIIQSFYFIHSNCQIIRNALHLGK